MYSKRVYIYTLAHGQTDRQSKGQTEAEIVEEREKPTQEENTHTNIRTVMMNTRSLLARHVECTSGCRYVFLAIQTLSQPLSFYEFNFVGECVCVCSAFPHYFLHFIPSISYSYCYHCQVCDYDFCRHPHHNIFIFNSIYIMYQME